MNEIVRRQRLDVNMKEEIRHVKKKEKTLRNVRVLWTPDSKAYEVLGNRLTIIRSEVSDTDSNSLYTFLRW